MITVDSPVTGKRETLTQSQFNTYMAQTNGAVLKWIVSPVLKHQEHDQSTHGSWANTLVGNQTLLGTTVTGIIDKLSEKDTPGFTIDLRTKTSPKDGFIASDEGAERRLDWAKASSSRKNLRNEIINYVVDHAELLDGAGAFFGGWVDEGVLYLDVSRRYTPRSEGVRAGFKNEQKAIYDVVKDSYIYMKDEVDERTNKARSGGSSEASKGNDPTGIGSLRGRDGGSPTGQRVNSPHVCLGRYQGVEKHLSGEHDQATHGAWASGRYPANSVKAARDGAKEYLFQKGLKGDETIDYTKIVANLERASKIADIYEKLPKMDTDAVDEYEALATEVEEQFDYMTKVIGVKVEFVANDPYKTSKEMFEDVSKGSLKVLSTESTGAHPLFSDTQNNKFRAVHDYFGHAATGRGFGQNGEEAAWVHHSQMFTESASAALTTETRGQNSFFNNRGKQFADQKVALLPSEFWQVPKVFSKTRVIYFAPGLKPVIKHSGGDAHGGGDDQSSHGNWAGQGYTEEQIAGMEAMSDVGPTLDDLQEILDSLDGSSIYPGMDDFRLIVENDQSLYESATEDIDARVEERLEQLQAEFPNHEYTEQEKMEIHENVQNEMIAAYIDENSGDLHAEYAASQGGGDTETLLVQARAFFDDVYSYDHDVKNIDGETTARLTSESTSIDIVPSPIDNGESAIQLRGVVKDGNASAGEFQRTFYKEDGVWMVEHDYFKMKDEYQGLGYGKNFIEQQENWYTERGFGGIIVGTAWDGARTWARAGFDWTTGKLESNIISIANSAMQVYSLQKGTPERAQFDSLMSRVYEDYSSNESGWTGTKMRSITETDFPFPNDFAVIGYQNRTSTDLDYTNDFSGKPVKEIEWAGKTLMDGLFLKYQKSLTAEGRTVLYGPIDRDGDGMVYDGTPREKPASAVNS